MKNQTAGESGLSPGKGRAYRLERINAKIFICPIDAGAAWPKTAKLKNACPRILDCKPINTRTAFLLHAASKMVLWQIVWNKGACCKNIPQTEGKIAKKNQGLAKKGRNKTIAQEAR